MSWSCCCDKHRAQVQHVLFHLEGLWEGGPGERTGPGQGEAQVAGRGLVDVGSHGGPSLSGGPCAPECLITLEMGTQQAARPLRAGAGLGGSGLLVCGTVECDWMVVSGASPLHPAGMSPWASRTPLKCVPWGSFRRRRALRGLPRSATGGHACSAHSHVARGFSWAPGPRIQAGQVSAAQLTLCFSPVGS